MRKVLLILVFVLLMPIFVHADEDEDAYRWQVEYHFYEVADQYELIDVYFVFYTMDSGLTDDVEFREEWARQIDDTIANELHDFFSREEISGSEYNDQVLDYLESYFEIEEEEESRGFFAAIGDFFRSIFSFFANLF